MMASRGSRRTCTILPPSPSIWTTSWRYLSQSSRTYEQKQQHAPLTARYERSNTPLPYSYPEALKNVRPQPRTPFAIRRRETFVVNDDPKKLDAAYEKILGEDTKLPAEIKWQAVTHKSFDHGRQPFNEKLAFLGKKILQMHISLHLLSTPPQSATAEKPLNNGIKEAKVTEPSKYLKPEPFAHEDYKYLRTVTRNQVDNILFSKEVREFLGESRLVEVIRWKPADASNLARSGQTSVVFETLYAIVGAVALQNGGYVAGRLVRDRILHGLKRPS